ncbi:MAG: hypothetical protein OD811_00200 [Alphaproteobacteria bacterium]
MVQQLSNNINLSQLQSQLASGTDRNIRVAINGQSVESGGRLARLATKLQGFIERLPFVRSTMRAKRQQAAVDNVRSMLKDRFPHNQVDAALQKIQTRKGLVRTRSLRETISDLGRANVSARTSANHLVRGLRPQAIMEGSDETLKSTLKAAGYDASASVKDKDNFRRVFTQVLDGFVSHKAIVNGVDYGREQSVHGKGVRALGRQEDEVNAALANFERGIETRAKAHAAKGAEDTAAPTEEKTSAPPSKRAAGNPLIPRKIDPNGPPPKPLRAGAADTQAFAVSLAAKAAAGFVENPRGLGQYEADMDAARFNLESAVARSTQENATPGEVAREVANYNRHINGAVDRLIETSGEWLSEGDKDRVKLALETHIAKQVISDVATHSDDLKVSRFQSTGRDTPGAGVALNIERLNKVFLNRGDSLATVFYGGHRAMHASIGDASGEDKQMAKTQALASPRGLAHFFDLYSRTVGSSEFVRPAWLDSVVKNPGAENPELAKIAATQPHSDIEDVRHAFTGQAQPPDRSNA